MASRSSTSMAVGAMGAAVLGSSALQAFLTPAASPSAPSAPSAPVLRGASRRTEGRSGLNSTVVSAGLATAAVAMARRRSVARAAEEKPFAGGLIGGESAFAGQDFNFDPLGLSVKCEKYLPWFREAELKHGRIAMLAWVGLVVPEFARIPGPDACYGAKNVVEAHNACAGDPYFPFVINSTDFYGTSGHQVGPLFQVFAFCGLVEMLTTFAKTSNISNKPGLTLENAGDYRLGVNFLPNDPAKVKEMKLKELKNGRLAMLAFGGAITQATLTGNGFPWLYAQKEQKAATFGASTQRSSARAGFGGSRVARQAESKGYKMSAAVPFLPMSPALEGLPGEEEGFDPMGFSLAIDIRWLREAELKHGRVAMLATVGWIATDLGLRVPGEPFQVSTIEAHDAMVKFGSMPQILVWLGYLELFGFLAIINMQEGKTDRKPGDFGLRGFYPADAKGQYDMQVKELRNGRLAMLAFSGIVTVGVLTQEKWPFFNAVVNAVPEAQQATASSHRLCGATVVPQTAQTRTVRHAATSKSLPFLPKPQNLGGLVGGEAEFDPLGFSDTFDVKWLRESELKHGRVCMLATVGFVTEQYWNFPGCPETPDALQAIYTAPPNLTALLIFIAVLDLLEFFNAFSWPDKRRGDIFSMNYVFLGDFVDRGAYSCDVVSLLFALKVLYPLKIFLVRGNHEDRLMNVNYGFHADCARKFGRDGDDIWERVNDVFEFLPISAVVGGEILCIHGGIGDSINSLDDLRGIPKPIQVAGEINERTTRQDRMVLDALWSDPTESDQVLGVHVSPRGKNTCRFGPDRVQEFNRRNSLKLIIRAHECVQHGYEYFAAGQLLTVFSATNYCNQHDNDGAMVVLVKDERTGELVEHAQVIKSGLVDTSYGWNDQQFRAPSPMRRCG